VPPLTGAAPIDSLIDYLARRQESAPIAAVLSDVRRDLAALDAGGPGAAPDRYHDLARRLGTLPAGCEVSRLFQVDFYRRAQAVTLGQDVLDEIARGIGILHRLEPPIDDLRAFREAFVQRYDRRKVPLTEVLDEESGIGFGTPAQPSSPLLSGLAFPPAEKPAPAFGAREDLLMRKLLEVTRSGGQEIVLEEADLAGLPAKVAPLPDSFAALAAVAAESQQSLEMGRFRVFLDLAFGPSGARLLGRFCHGDEVLSRHVNAYLRVEEAHLPEAIFAEIVHQPEGRTGNVLLRPLLREYEIPFLGTSGAAPERQIPLDDLLIAVEGSRVVLRSRRLGREVVPRLSTAHVYGGTKNLSTYRFLCALQEQGVAGYLNFSWGPLDAAEFLPRVTYGKVVLSRARWRLGEARLLPLSAARGDEVFAQVQVLRDALGLPRHVLFTDGENQLPVDLDNVLSIEALAQQVRDRQQVVLTEFFPGPDELCALGPKGAFVHELVVPFQRLPAGPGAEVSPQNGRSMTQPMQIQRRFPPGSEWLYAKLYAGPDHVEKALRALLPVLRSARSSGAADQWFFLRYGDPDWHLRLRLHGAPGRLRGEVQPAIEQAASSLLSAGWAWRIQLDTYEREIERYGGEEGILLAERLFHAGSEAVLDLLNFLSGDAGEDGRWRLALLSLDCLLRGLGLTIKERLVVLRQVRGEFAREFRVDATLDRQLGERYRRERPRLERLLGGADGPGPQVRAVLDRYGSQVAAIGVDLRICAGAGRLNVPLLHFAADQLHMQMNRCFRSAARAHELVVYDFLARLCESQVARTQRSTMRAIAP
jgi:thiopeptide-type bacteriocin biosynthesis protein